MHPVSDAFLAALRAPHQMTTRVELWDGATKLTDSLTISDGTVTIDRTNAVYATCEVTAQLTSTRGLVVDSGTIDLDALNVYGLHLRPFRGIRFSGRPGTAGTVEEVPLGRFLIERISRDVTDTSVKISASGYRSYLRDDKFLTPYTPRPLDVPQRDVLKTLILDSRPGETLNSTEFNALPTTPTARGTTWEADRLAAIDELATALGVQVYPDRSGVWRFKPVANLASAPVSWIIDAGATGVLTKAEIARDRASVFNAVVASSETTSSAVLPRRSVAYHSVASSPTRWGGPFGRKPYFYSSPQLKTQADCDRAAAAILAKLTIADTVIDLESAPNPALNPDDVIKVVLPDATSLYYLVDAVTIPLTPGGALTVAVRQRPEQVTP